MLPSNSFARLAAVATGIAVLVASPRASAERIACVGDSITFGYGLGDPDAQSYPAQLQALLGADHEVENFGVSGATLLQNGDRPYRSESAFGQSDAFAPDVVVVMLGTNDAKPGNWSREAEFAPDYAELIAHYRALGALVYVATTPPVFPPGAFEISPSVIADEVVPLVMEIATDADAPLIDVFAALSDHAAEFPDTVHPNATGAGLIAAAVQAALEQSGFGGEGTGGAGAGGGAGEGGTGGATQTGSGAAGEGVAEGGTGVGSIAGSTSGGSPNGAGMASGGGSGAPPGSAGSGSSVGGALGVSGNGATAGSAASTGDNGASGRSSVVAGGGAGGRTPSGAAAGTPSVTSSGGAYVSDAGTNRAGCSLGSRRGARGAWSVLVTLVALGAVSVRRRGVARSSSQP